MQLPEPLPATVMVVGGDCEILLMSWRHPDVIRYINQAFFAAAHELFLPQSLQKPEYGICYDPKEALSA